MTVRAPVLVTTILAVLAAAAPAWAVAPGGNGRIYGRESDHFAVSSIAPDGSGLRAEPSVSLPVQTGNSADGTEYLSFSVSDPNGLAVVKFDTPGREEVLPSHDVGLSEFVAALSPDGKTIVFVGAKALGAEKGVYAVERGTTAAPRLLFPLAFAGPGETTIGTVTQIAFSPTDPSVLLMSRFYSYDGGSSGQTVVDRIDPGTGALVRHVTTPRPAIGTPITATTPVDNDGSFDFAPDGQSIVFARSTSDQSPPADFVGLLRQPLSGGAPAILYDGSAVPPGFFSTTVGPVASAPDGSAVAFLETRYQGFSAETEIKSVPAAGGAPTSISHGPGTYLATMLFWRSVPLRTVEVTQAPTGITREKTATFAFAVEDPPAGTLQCRLDGAAFSACSSPFTTPALDDGDHTFSVRFLAFADGPGPVRDVAWRIDTTTPATTIDAGPTGVDNEPDAEIRFSTTATDLERFECSIDGGPSLPCESPLRLSGLRPGPHSVHISAIDRAGNVENPPAELIWSVRGTAVDETPKCATPTAAAGAIVGKALTEDACWAADVVDGVAAMSSPGPAKVNGIEITPRDGARIVISTQLSGGALRVTGPSTIGIGAAKIDVDRPIEWGGAAQGGVVFLNKALEIANKEFAGLKILSPPVLEISADNGGQTKLTFKLNLPANAFSSIPGRPASGGAQEDALVKVDLTVTATNDFGVTGGGKITIPELWLFGRIKLKDLSLGYDAATGFVDGTVGMELARAGKLAASSIVKDATIGLAVQLGPGGLAGTPLRKIGLKVDGIEKHLFEGFFLQRLSLDLAPGTDAKGRPTIVLGGGGGLSFGPKLQFKSLFEGELFSLDGRFALNIPASPPTVAFSLDDPLFTIDLTGEAKVVDIPLQNIGLKLDSLGGVKVTGKQELSAFGFGSSMEITDTYFDALHLSAGFRGKGTITLPGIGSTDAEMTISNAGVAYCGQLLGSARVGFGKRFTSPSTPFEVFASGCDVGPFTAAGGGASRAHTAAAARRIEVARGRELLVIAARGTSGAPKVTVTGPGGARIVTPAGAKGVRTARTILVQAPAARTTYVLVRAPAPGTWRVSGAGLRDVRSAGELPPVQVSAKVRGGRLRWTLTPRRGQKVTFVERAAHTVHAIATTTKRSGAVRFTPAATRDRTRRIVATVVQNGLPRTEVTVATVRATPARIARVAKLRLTRKQATWRAQGAATSYVVAQRFADGTTTTTTVRKPKLAFGRRMPVSVTVVAVAADGRAGASATESLPKR